MVTSVPLTSVLVGRVRLLLLQSLSLLGVPLLPLTLQTSQTKSRSSGQLVLRLGISQPAHLASNENPVHSQDVG